MIRTILVPVDGSSHSLKAVDLAGDLAGRYGARIILLNVTMYYAPLDELALLCDELDAPQDVRQKLDDTVKTAIAASTAGYGGPVVLPAPPEAVVPLAELVCRTARERLAAAGNLDVDVRIVDGSAAEEILAMAESENADMIVMGSRGLGKFADLLMGGVSHKVSQLAKCTCVTVK